MRLKIYAMKRKSLLSKTLCLESDLIHINDDIANLVDNVKSRSCKNETLRNSLQKFLNGRKSLDDIISHTTRRNGKRGLGYNQPSNYKPRYVRIFSKESTHAHSFYEM